MYPHTPMSTPELTALRTRLYRPDPPAGAVEEYLEALRADAPPPVVDTRAVPARGRGHARGVAALAAMVVLAVGLGTVMSLSHQASATGVVTVAGGTQLELPPVPGTPIGTLYGPAGTTGLFDANGSQVVVSVNCSGDGTLDLRIGDEPPTVLTCERGGPALAMLPSAGALDRFTIAVTRHGAVRWSLAVGAENLAAA